MPSATPPLPWRGGCSSFIERLGKKQLWVQNARQEKRGFLMIFNALNLALDLVLDP